MKILIKLSSALLGTALSELLNRELGNGHSLAVTDVAEFKEGSPDKIVVDARSVSHDLLSEWPEAKVILVDTGLHEDEVVELLRSFRIDGIISTDTDCELFTKALSVVRTGQAWIDNGKVRAILSRIETPARNCAGRGLSKKEQAIMVQISQGLKNREIAERLFISEQTVKAHLSRIFRKCNVKNRAQLVPLAMKLNPLSSS